VPERSALSIRRVRGRKSAALTSFSIVSALVLGSVVAAAAPAAHAAGDVDGSVSGIVFQDFTSGGWYTTGSAAAGVPRNRPVEGVAVTAFDAEGDLVGTAVSAANGTYTLPVTDAFSDHLRVEFSGWDDAYEPAFAAQGTPPPTTQGDNNTSVHLVTLDDAGSATGIDFGLVIPDQVIQQDAPIATVIQYAGDPNYTGPGSTADRPTLVAQPWSKTGSAETPGHFEQRTELADYGQVGSTWGISFNRVTNSMILAASLKRMSGLGDLGLGGIYRVPEVLQADGSIRTGAAAENWFSAQGLALNGGGTLDLGQSVLDSFPGRGLGAPNAPSPDRAGFALAARIGIGGVATTLDGETLFITNLHDGEVYGIDVSDPDDTTPPVWRVSTPVGANQQLWALTLHAGRLYLGYVDTGSAPGASAAVADMNAYVVSVPVASAANPAGTVAAGDWRSELIADLGYVKGSNMNGWPNTSGLPQLRQWNSWTDTWVWSGPPAGSVGFNSDWGWTHAYPQPVLSSLAFDIDGYLNLGFTDRTSIQSGNLNVASDTELPLNRFYETVANGDILVAAPVGLGLPTGAGCPTTETARFALECNGKVGSRAVRTGSVSGQAPTYNNNQGPATGEFFNDSQNIGEAGVIHNDNTLGAVATYPGVDEVMSTAIDPLTGIYRSGLMWFDQRNGTATRGFDQVEGLKNVGSAAFQKGGGLGGVALLGVAAPVEIGNRVWLDADLNGRQDPDEPAIDGAVVELWTADAAGSPVTKIGERTTATINGQPGTYYFRTDDTDIMVGANANPFVPNGSYTLVFRAGESLALGGPNAGHEGFAGLTWDDLRLTEAQVRVAPTATNGGTTEVDDSNPDVQTGQYALEVGGPGENNHTYDAGWYGVAPYEVLKTIVGPGPEDETFTVVVESAVNFRGQDRLAASGSDPAVTTTQFELTPGEPVSSEQELPYGYTLTFAETENLPDTAIAFTPALSGSSTPKGRLVINAAGPLGADGTLTLGVTNSYGALQVEKTLVGDAGAVAASGAVEFTVNWTSSEPDVVDAETSGSFVVTGDGTQMPDPALRFPAGTTVQLTETAPTVLPPGVEWTGASWTAAPNIAVSEDGQTATVTITSSGQALTTVGLTNTLEDLLGSFTVAKQLDGDFDLADPELDGVSIPVEYSYTDLVTGEDVSATLTLNRANGFSATGPTLPTGTAVTLVEGTPVGGPPNLSWGDVSWTIDGGAATAPIEFEIGDGTTVAAIVTNQVTELFGTFEVVKEFDGAFAADDPRLADVVITVTWEAPDGSSGDILLTQAGGWRGTPTDAAGATLTFPLGTTLVLAESNRVGGHPSLEWGDVGWGASANPDDPEQGLVTVSAEETAAVVTLTNGTNELVGTLRLAKDVTGDFDLDSPELASAFFRVQATWEGGSAELLLNQANGWASGLGVALPASTTVTLTEIEAGGTGPSVEWGLDPAWAGGGITTNADGTATLVIGAATDPLVTLTNTATELRSTFSVAKTVSGDLTLEHPGLADAVFTVEWTATDGQSGTFELVAPDWTGTPVDGEGAELTFPLGTVVTLTEPAISGTGPSIEWGSVTWSDGQQPDGSAQVAIVDDETVLEIGLTNQATALTGTFGVQKLVAGDFDLESPEIQPAVFTVVASWDAAPGLEAGQVELVLDRSNDWTAPGIELPTGTVVTLAEVEASGTGPSVAWDAHAWSGEGLTVNDDGTASFVIGDNTAPTFTVTNESVLLTGVFSVLKQVTGPVADDLADGHTFVVTYTYEGLAAPGTLSVGNGQTVTSPAIPAGTEVTITEVRPTGGLPGGAGWGNPVWELADGSTTTGSVTLVIGADDHVELVLENPTIPPLPPTGIVLPWVIGILAALLLAVGAAMFVVGRRRIA